MAAKRSHLDSIGRSCTTTAFMNHLHAAIQKDQEPKHKIGEDILRMYDKATPQEQKIMDKTFAILCGHTLENS